MTKADLNEKTVERVRRRKIGKTIVSQHARGHENVTNKQLTILGDSKTRGVVSSTGSPARELILMNPSKKSLNNLQLPSRCSPYPFAAVNSVRTNSANSADHDSSLKGTPWEDAMCGQDSSKKRKFRAQRSEEELQSIEFLKLFGWKWPARIVLWDLWQLPPHDWLKK